MDEYPTGDPAADEQAGKRGPRPLLVVVLAVAIVACAVALVAWLASGPSAPPAAERDESEAEAAPPLETLVKRSTIQREDLNEMIDTPATTIAWAVSHFGFRPPELPAEEPWNPPSPELVLTLDDPGPVYTSFVRNVPVGETGYTVDESIDLVLDDDGETVIGVRYARFTDAPVENADLFFELPE